MTPHARARRFVLDAGRLSVDGERTILCGAEVHNSSASTPASIARAFERVATLGADTVLAPISWELFEPEEGRVDETLVVSMIESASRWGLTLVPLWFGSWKNGSSSYVPGWVKTDTVRFPRVLTRHGSLETLSPFGAESRDADARAFAELARVIAERDTGGVVGMVQVENEVGVLGDARDRGPLAQEAWESAVPDGVFTALERTQGLALTPAWVERGRRTRGSWGEVFGAGEAAEEAFMAVAFARYVDDVAAAGGRMLDVPFLVNAWLDSELDLPDDLGLPALAGGQHPGTYPSGGPILRVAGLWRTFAPHIDILAPDIYFGDFDAICRGFAAVGAALFIPEMRRGPDGVAQMFAALGTHGAIGVSPFGVDSLRAGSAEETILRDAYRLLGAAAAVLRRSPDAWTWGFRLGADIDEVSIEHDGVVLRATRSAFGADAGGYGLVVQEAPGVLVVIGRGCVVGFSSSGSDRVGMLDSVELEVVDGALAAVRTLNGDENRAGTALVLPPLEAEPSPFPIPSDDERSGIIRVRLYRWQ